MQCSWEKHFTPLPSLDPGRRKPLKPSPLRQTQFYSLEINQESIGWHKVGDMSGLEPGISWFRVEYSAAKPRDPDNTCLSLPALFPWDWRNVPTHCFSSHEILKGGGVSGSKTRVSETVGRSQTSYIGIFKIEDSVQVARLWGIRKSRPAMNYDKLSRSIRQYYKKGIIRKPDQAQRLVYQFVKN
ncbi:hypothetical protein Bbelb_231060 [Branchiostoma belcheri]|nr:hypothetical protein Bbelb_231060 [Branchiostoma belcheri]